MRDVRSLPRCEMDLLLVFSCEHRADCSSSHYTGTLLRNRIERQHGRTAFQLCACEAYSAEFVLCLAPDTSARAAEAIARFVVAGGKIDEMPFFLTSPFFPAKNVQATLWIKFHSDTSM